METIFDVIRKIIHHHPNLTVQEKDEATAVINNADPDYKEEEVTDNAG